MPMAVSSLISIMALTELPSIKETIVNLKEVLAVGAVAVAAGVAAAPAVVAAGGSTRSSTPPVIARVEFAQRSSGFRFGAIG
jgi:hypothetical protein